MNATKRMPGLTAKVLRGLSALIGNRMISAWAGGDIDDAEVLKDDYTDRKTLDDVAAALRWLDAQKRKRARRS